MQFFPPVQGGSHGESRGRAAESGTKSIRGRGRRNPKRAWIKTVTFSLVSDQMKRDDLLRGRVDKMKSATATYGFDASWWRARGF